MEARGACWTLRLPIRAAPGALGGPGGSSGMSGDRRCAAAAPQETWRAPTAAAPAAAAARSRRACSLSDIRLRHPPCRLQRAWRRLRERPGPVILAVTGGEMSAGSASTAVHLLPAHGAGLMSARPAAASPPPPPPGILLLVLVAAAAYSSGRHSGRLEVSGCAGLSPPAGGDSVAPEGSITASFAYSHDYAGRPRSVRSAGGVVAADHGRCSEIGEGARGRRALHAGRLACLPACRASCGRAAASCSAMRIMLDPALQAPPRCARAGPRSTPRLRLRCARACTTPAPAAWAAGTLC